MNNMEKLAYEIINFCKKWGMWRDVQILTGGKCYSACQNTPDKIKVREEKNPEEYTSGYRERANGEIEDVDYSNPEKILDMTFEGPLYLLLRVRKGDVKRVFFTTPYNFMPSPRCLLSGVRIFQSHSHAFCT